MMSSDEIDLIRTGLQSNDPEALSEALDQAKIWLNEVDVESQSDTLVGLLLSDLRDIIDRYEEVVNQAAELLALGFQSQDRFSEMPQFADLIAWYDKQMDYDDVVFKKHVESAEASITAELEKVLTDLKSNDPAKVRQALSEVEEWLFFSGHVGSGLVFVPILLGLKDVLDKGMIEDESILAEVEKILLEGLKTNRGLARPYLQLDDLYVWYDSHTQIEAGE